MYDFRARVWSPELAAFLQPDEFGFLGHSGTLWSWPGQNPYRWRDPSGRWAVDPATEDAAVEALAAAGEAGEIAAGWAVLPVAIVGYAGYNIYNQLDDFYHPIISHAENNQGKPNPGEPCQTENGGGGAKLPPTSSGAVGTDDGGDDGWAERRAGQLKAMIPPGAEGFITMAAGTARDPISGDIVRIIGTSEPNGYLRPGVTLAEGEVLAPGTGHAEGNVATYARANGLELTEVAATRPICPSCMQATYRAGGVPLGPLRLKF